MLVMTDHFRHHAKAAVTPNQTARTTALAFWKHFIVDYGFPDCLLMDQGWNFKSNLIKKLCNLGKVKKVRTSPYQPETNGWCEKFNLTLINMIGTLEQRDKSHWKDFLPTLVHVHNCTKTTLLSSACFIVGLIGKPQLPIDLHFGLATEKSIECSHNTFIQKLRERHHWCYEIADQNQQKESNHHKRLYNRKTCGSKLDVGDLCLVTWKALH